MVSLKTLDDFQKYLAGVTWRAADHSDWVFDTTLILATLIFIYRDEGTDIDVLTREDDYKNVLWAQINNQRYAFVYSHESYTIEMRKGSLLGEVILQLTDNDNVSKIIIEHFKEPMMWKKFNEKKRNKAS